MPKSPSPTVTVSVRGLVSVFALAATVTVPLPVPDAPFAIVSQDAFFEAVQAHPFAAVTVTLPFPPAAATGSPLAIVTAASLRLVNANRASFDVPAVELFDRRLRGVVRGHLDKAETTRPIGCAVDDDLGTVYLACFRKRILQVLVCDSPS